MVPPHTDRLILSKLSKITGKYLPRIAGAADGQRKALLCKLACRLFDVWTERRVTLFRSQTDLPAFRVELGTDFSAVVMPLLERVQLTETELEAIGLAVAGRQQHWLAVRG